MSDDIRTLAEYRAAAEATGEWESTEVEFSNDGETWHRYLLPTEEHPHPLLARATVVRNGKADAVQTVLLWDEAIPDDDFARLWQVRPHVLFGGSVERAGLRRAFPSAVAGIVASTREQWAAPAAPAPEVPWEEQIEAAADVAAVDAVHAAMKTVRAVTPALEVALKARRRALTAAPVAAEPEPQPEAVPKRSRAKAAGS